MGYSVMVSRPAIVRLKQVAEAVPFASRRELLEALRQVGKEPTLLRPCRHEGPFRGRLIFQFRITHPPLTQRFTASVLIDRDEETLWITDISTDNPPATEPVPH